MTTQWNPAHTGGNGPGPSRDEGEERESGPAADGSVSERPGTRGPDPHDSGVHDSVASSPWNDERAAPDSEPSTPTREPASHQSGPWRGYTMPVPEHPEHAEERERAASEAAAFEPPAYDGITGYPDPSGAGTAQSASREDSQSDASAPGLPESHPESPEAARARQRRFGRHARPSAAAADKGGAESVDGDGNRRRRSEADHDDHDDPDGLAGWVGSLTEAADDTRIAGRNTGAFPVVTPDTERPDDQGGRPARRTTGRTDDRTAGADLLDDGPDGPAVDPAAGAAAERDAEHASERDAQGERPRRHTSRPAPGVAQQTTATWVPGPEDDERAEGTDAEEARSGTAETARTGAPAAAGATGDSARTVEPGTAAPEQGEAADDDPEPLPRRVPGPSAVSGAFRAIGADTTAPRTGPDASGSGTPGPDTGPQAVGGQAQDDSGSATNEEEYRPTSHDHWQPTSTTSRAELIERLDALSTLVELGQEDLPEEVLGRAGQLLDHAGARLRLSGEHTVVALAGGTGSGKSSLFNALCGLELSQTGVTRPTTSKAHACVWGHEGADALLSWLGVPTRYRHSRTSVLDTGNSELTGLVLLDLPDHDSVRSMHTAEADRLIGSVDLLVWVLDPQKYADAAVHHRYLAKMAGHGAVTVAVLNQVDKVAPDELEELLTDLRRLLETESGVHPRVITTSTVTGQGIREVREFLSETVIERRALVDRLVADLDQVIEPFEEFYGEGEIPEMVPAQVRSRIQEGLAKAAGVTAVADVVETNDVRRGKRRVGWPVARQVAKLRKDPLAAVQLDFLRRDEPGVGGPVDAHEAELETVLGEAADQVSAEMPGLWRRRMRTAARSGVAELPTELGEAVAGAVGDPGRSPSWWKTARAVQYALLAVAGVGFAWALLSLLSWLGGGITGLRMFDDPVFIAYSGALLLASLLVGWLTGVGCGNLVEVAAVQRREDVERTAQGRVREIAGVRVVTQLENELARYRAFRAAYEVARVKD
ncbi:GTPase [Nocardiopsis valliformis]|uniref:GTPase n=1 Tax=Nocardiopsis valliformis TaxID=239974 RepID=UPI00034924C4|nr:GTPase [Nocardiopsis valliformis]